MGQEALLTVDPEAEEGWQALARQLQEDPNFRERWVMVAEVEERTGWDRSWIWRQEKAGNFPPRFYLDPAAKRGPRWLDSVVVAFLRYKALQGQAPQ